MLTSPANFFRRVQDLKESDVSFVIATIIRVRGSASAKTGSKALFDEQGVNVFGYIGGGCAESHVAQEACEALQEKKPRIVEIDLDDEVFGLMPCGGVMDVYLEPHFSSPEVVLPDCGPWNAGASQLLRELGFQSTFTASQGTTLRGWREVFLALAAALAKWKGYPLLPLRNSKGSGELHLPVLSQHPREILVFGQTRITEEFCRLLPYFDWQARIFRSSLPVEPNTHLQVCELPMNLATLTVPEGAWVIIASHHKQDAAIAERALLCGADYVALVASEKRARLIANDLSEQGIPVELLHKFFVPAGLNMPTDTPLQIAFSILCEILNLQN